MWIIYIVIIKNVTKYLLKLILQNICLLVWYLFPKCIENIAWVSSSSWKQNPQWAMYTGRNVSQIKIITYQYEVWPTKSASWLLRKTNLVLIFEGPTLHLGFSNCFLHLCHYYAANDICTTSILALICSAAALMWSNVPQPLGFHLSWGTWQGNVGSSRGAEVDIEKCSLSKYNLFYCLYKGPREIRNCCLCERLHKTIN